jgi:aquaporin Z
VGKQSGGHFNPSITFAFFRLRKVDLWDVTTGHFLGAIVGVTLAVLFLRGAPSDQAVQLGLTAPGVYSDGAAFVEELTISFILMTTVLFVSNHWSLARYTP